MSFRLLRNLTKLEILKKNFSSKMANSEDLSANKQQPSKGANENMDTSAATGSQATSSNLSIASKSMCYFCFDVIIAELDGKESPNLPENIPEGEYSLFVSWFKGENENRGCLGTFDKIELGFGIREYAFISAFRDPRFPPIRKNELSGLTNRVSILKKFEDCSDNLDWEIGVHGLRCKFDIKGKTGKSTYLPNVILENKWDKVQTIDKLLRKGGYKDEITEEIRKSVRLIRYQSDIASASYEEYEKRNSSKI